MKPFLINAWRTVVLVAWGVTFVAALAADTDVSRIVAVILWLGIGLGYKLARIEEAIRSHRT